MHRKEVVQTYQHTGIKNLHHNAIIPLSVRELLLEPVAKGSQPNHVRAPAMDAPLPQFIFTSKFGLVLTEGTCELNETKR